MSAPRLKVESTEFLRLDAIRLFASLCVVAHHWKTLLRLPDLAGPSGIVYPKLQFLELSVDVFFVISGVIITRVYATRVKDRRSYLQYLVRRIARIYPLHLLTLLLMAGLYLKGPALGLVVNGDDRVASFLRNVFLVNAWWRFSLSFNIVAWSISVEWLCYLLFPLMLYLLRRFPWTWIAACGLPLVLSCCPEWVLFHAFEFGLLRGLLGFYIGAGAQLHAGELRRLSIHGSIAALLFVVALCLSLTGISRTHLYVFAFAIPLCALVADLRGKASGFARLVAPLSQLTFSIYLWHIPFSILMQVGLRHAMRPMVWNSLVVLSVIPLFALCYLSFVAIEDPARTWISRLTGGRPSSSPLLREGAEIAP